MLGEERRKTLVKTIHCFSFNIFCCQVCASKAKKCHFFTSSVFFVKFHFDYSSIYHSFKIKHSLFILEFNSCTEFFLSLSSINTKSIRISFSVDFFSISLYVIDNSPFIFELQIKYIL